jgi:hypothetical protein
MEIFLDEKGILTHISRPLAELQEKYRLTDNENQEMRSAKRKIFDKLSTDDKRCKNYLTHCRPDTQSCVFRVVRSRTRHPNLRF